MTDRELLEFAAKAAGIKVPTKKDAPWEGINERGIYRDISIGGDGARVSYWNPLTDDGDALRLAVKLGIGMRHHVNWSQVFSLQTGVEDFHHDTDPYAATRRAIVRAAAEIGRGMTQKVSNDYLPEDNYYKTQAEAEELERSKT